MVEFESEQVNVNTDASDDQSTGKRIKRKAERSREPMSEPMIEPMQMVKVNEGEAKVNPEIQVNHQIGQHVH